ncbi:MAG: hypothetical protein WBZ42_04960 [Halobacteriota archaeon]
MIRKASLLVASLLVAFLATACVTEAFWAGTAVPNSQTNQHLESNPRLNAISEPRVLAFQSATPSNSTQANFPLIADNTTRIIVPISRVENTSSIGAQPFNGFVFPTGLVIAATILILLVVLAFLFLRLLRDGDNEPPADTRPLGPTVPSTSEPHKERPRQIPIDEAETEVERKNSSLVSAESRRVRSIPIDSKEEAREPEDNSK